MPIFLPGKFVGCDAVHRACHYFRKIVKPEDRLHIADPNIVAPVPMMILGDAGDSACATLRVDPVKVRRFVKNYPNMCWATHISKGRAVYVPVNYPYHTRSHWCGVVMWRRGDEHLVRVYNSMKTYLPNDMKVAKMVCEVVRVMNPKLGTVKFKFFANDNHVEQ